MIKDRFDHSRLVDADWGDTLQIRPDHLTMALVYCGYLVVRLNGSHCVVHQGALFSLPPHDHLEWIQTDNFKAAVFFFSPMFVNRNLNYATICSEQFPMLSARYGYPSFRPFLFRSPAYNGILPVPNNMETILQRYFDVVQEQFLTQPDCRWSCRARSALFSILRLADQEFARLTDNASVDPLVHELVYYIGCHLEEDLSLELLCRRFHLNRTTLGNKFKESMGMTIFQYILSQRIEHCKADLAFTELPLYEIAAKFRFTDATYFTKVFKSQVGIPPLKYRQQSKQSRR